MLSWKTEQLANEYRREAERKAERQRRANELTKKQDNTQPDRPRRRYRR